MRIVAHIHGLARRVGNIERGISADLLESLCAIYPQGRVGGQGHSFHAILPVDDKRTTQLLDLLAEAGLEPWIDTSQSRDANRQYTLRLQREYDEIDFEVCNHLEFAPDEQGKGLYRTDRQRGQIIMEAPPISSASFVHKQTWCVVRDNLRRVLQGNGLKNLVFLPTKKRYESVDYNLYDEEDVWWELRSDLVLPPVSSSMTLIHKDHTPFTGDFRRGCRRIDGLYFPVELHYRRADIEGADSFDLAHTYEMFGALPDEYDRPLVASKRFYEVCKQHDVKTGWVPVRIED